LTTCLRIVTQAPAEKMRRMTRRSITDEEIGLIKAMPGRQMRNRDIRLYFNRRAFVPLGLWVVGSSLGKEAKAVYTNSRSCTSVDPSPRDERRRDGPDASGKLQ
jgi:hypothetical protein